MKKILTFLSLTLLSSFSYAQLMSCGAEIPPERIAFQTGEVLSYRVIYNASFINAEVADITFRTTHETYMERDCFKIEAVGETRPFYAIFFKLKDIYTTWMDKKTLLPIKATANLSEGSYRYRSTIDFDWRTLKARTEGHNIKSRESRRHMLNLTKCSYDAISLFFNMRSADLSTLNKGENQSLSLVLEDSVRTVQFKFIDREVRKLESQQEVNTLKFACQFATSNDESFKDGAEFFLWLSDDDNRIPIYLESPIRVGKVMATINSWSGLKYPFKSLTTKRK